MLHNAAHSSANDVELQAGSRQSMQLWQVHAWSAALTSALAGGAAARALSASLSCRTYSSCR